MYSDLGWDVEESWRGYKHWDRLQTGIKFCGKYNQTTTSYNDVVIYRPEKRLSDGEISLKIQQDFTDVLETHTADLLTMVLKMLPCRL